MAHGHPALRAFRFDMLSSDSDCDDFLNSDGLFADEPSIPRADENAFLDCPESVRPRVRKGQGPESKKNAPDLHDLYRFEARSVAYARMVALGHRNVSLVQIVQIGGFIEEQLRAAYAPISQRNRAARRRKPNAFHWLDENWRCMGLIPFDQIVIDILGIPPAGQQPIPKR
jgi:hypothetical protein